MNLHKIDMVNVYMRKDIDLRLMIFFIVIIEKKNARSMTSTESKLKGIF